MPEAISVLVTARNAEKTIQTSVRSALFALGKHDEVIVLLDQCTDETEKRLDAIRDSRVRKVVSETRLGINKSRNALLDLSANEFVAVLDADDICLPWRFWICRRMLGSGDLLFGTAIIFGSQLRPLPVLPQYPIALNPAQVELALCLGNPLVHSTMFGRKVAIQTVGGYSDSLSEDYDLWLRMVAAGMSLRRLAIPVILYRFHAGQASQVEGFNETVSSNPTLRESKRKAVESVSKRSNLENLESLDLEVELRSKLYEARPLMRLEHAGLPEPLRRWKNRKKSH